MNSTDHGQRECSPPGENLGDARPRSNQRFKLPPRPAELLAAHFDCLPGIERLNWKRATFVCVNQCRERVELALLP